MGSEPSKQQSETEDSAPKIVDENADPEEQQHLLDVSRSSKASDASKTSESSAISAKVMAENQWMLNHWDPVNLAIPLTYFSVGFTYYFLSTPVTYYMIDTLDSSGAEQEVITTLQVLPWSFKLFFGFISDTVPIAGKRRKPYLILGWLVFGASNLALALLGEPNFQWLCVFILTQTCAYLFSDVMADTLVVERAKMETVAAKGTLQANAYMMRAFGYLVGAIAGATLYNEDEWGWGLTIAEIFALNGIVPLIIVLPFTFQLYEQPMTTEVPSYKDELHNLWDLVQLRSVWRPLIFVFIYNALFVSNASWNSFLVDGLGFSEFFIGCITIAICVVTWLGLWIYKRFLFNRSWRTVYLLSGVVIAFFSFAQIALELRWNVDWGLPNAPFAMGDQASQYFVIAIQFLPVCRMFLSLCPNGSEGMSYAMLTTYSNCASTLADDISTLLTYIWNVGNETISEGDYSGMWKLTLLVTALQFAPLVLVGLLPANAKEQRKLQQSNARAWWGGFWFVSSLVITWVWTIVESVIMML